MRSLTFERDKGRPSQYDVLEFGFNFSFDDIRAALVLVQLEKPPRFNRQRKDLVDRYSRSLSKADADLILPFAELPEMKAPSYRILFYTAVRTAMRWATY